MTVATQVARVTRAWTGVEGSFVAGFPAQHVDHVAVHYTDALDVTTLLVRGVHFSASLDPTSDNYTAVPLAMPAAPGTVTLTRNTPALQSTKFPNLQAFDPAVLERLFDAAAMRAAEFKGAIADGTPLPVVVGASGTDAGLRFLYSNNLAMADPGAGFLRFNRVATDWSSPPAAPFTLAISRSFAEPGAADISNELLSWDDNGTAALRGVITFKKIGAPQNFFRALVTGTVTNNGPWMLISLTWTGGAGAFALGELLSVQFVPTGGAAVEVSGVNIADGTTATPATNDIFMFRDVSANANRVATLADLLALLTSINLSVLNIAGGSADADPALDDLVITRDVSTGANRIVEIRKLLGAGTALQPLEANTTIYVRPDGADVATRSGLVNDAANAFLTPQFAINTARERYNLNGKILTIKLATNNYTSGISIKLPFIGGGKVQVIGDESTPTVVPANVKIIVSGPPAIEVDEAALGEITFRGMQVRAAGNYGIVNGSHALVLIGDMEFGDCGTYIGINRAPGNIRSVGALFGFGNAQNFCDVEFGTLEIDTPTTLTGTPNFAAGFANVRKMGCAELTGGFTGAAAGARFVVQEGAELYIGANSLDTYLPGSTAGVVSTDGAAIGLTVRRGHSASTVDMEAAALLTAPVTPGVQHRHPGHPKAWAKVNGDGTGIDVSYNVSGIVDDGTGLLTVTWDVDFNAAEYVVVATLQSSGGRACETGVPAAGSCQLRSFQTNPIALQDPGHYMVVALGDQ